MVVCLDYKELFDIHAQHLNYLMATHDPQWTGSWCLSSAVVPDDAHNEHKVHFTQIAQFHHQALLPLGSTASMDEHRLAVLGDFIKCWQAYVEYAKKTLESGRRS